MRRPRIYLSGPITKGDRTLNFATACSIHKELMERGFSVLNPMLSMMHPDAWVIDHETWLENDLPWVACADIVLRLLGESKGAEAECRLAELSGVEVTTSWHRLMEWKDEWDKKQALTECATS